MNGKTELKLLARQQSEHNWSAIPSEEAIPTEEANHFNTGALVFIELNPNHKIQSIYQAAKQLVGILQSFSRQREKFRTQEEEIEGWKQSLIYQSHELTRRELELETQHEELEQLEETAKIKILEQQRLEAKATSEEAQRLQEEAERSCQEGAWEHLRGEHQAQRAIALDEEQVRSIEGLLNRLLRATASSEPVQGQLTFCLELVEQQQTVLNQYWQGLEQQSSAQEQQVNVDRQVQPLENSWQDWQQAQEALEQARTELKLQQQMLSLKEDSARVLALHVQAQSELYQQLYQLATGSNSEDLGEQVNVSALEEMSLEELLATVKSLQQGLESSSDFVHDQEEELSLQQQAIEELKRRINQASEYDRLSLEGDLEFEQQRYQMLNETLVGQRRSLREREATLNLHQAVLLRRLGDNQENKINLEPVLLQLSFQQQQQTEELQRLESQIEQIRLTIQQSQENVEYQARDQADKHSELKQLELALQQQTGAVSELRGNLNAHQQTLQPIQDSLNELRQQLVVIAGLSQVQHPDNELKQMIEEIRQSIIALAPAPELAAS